MSAHGDPVSHAGSDERARPLASQRYLVCNWRDSTHPRAGGAEVYCEQLARQLSALGAEVTLLTSRPCGTARRERANFGQVIRLGGTFTTYPLVLAWLVWNRRRVDGVIDSENGIPYFTPLAVRRSTPVILLIHHVHQEQFAVYFPPVIRGVARWLERTATAWVYGRHPVCAVSPSTRGAIRRALGVRGSRVCRAQRRPVARPLNDRAVPSQLEPEHCLRGAIGASQEGRTPSSLHTSAA